MAHYNNKSIYKWSKTDISSLFDVRATILDHIIPEETRNEVGWTKGKQYFTQKQVFKILRSLNDLWSDRHIYELMRIDPESMK